MEVIYYKDKKLEKINQKHLDSLIDFIKAVWDREMTTEKFFTKREHDFNNNPYMNEGGSPISLIIENDKVLGHVMATPCGLWADGIESLMYWNSGLFLSPECRGKGWGIVLPEKLTRELPICNGFFVVPQQLKTHQKLGYHIVGKLPEYLKVLKPFRFFSLLDLSQIHQMPGWLRKLTDKRYSVIRKPIAFILSIFFKFYYFVIRIINSSKINNKIKIVDNFDDRVDILWNKSKNSIKNAQVRNSKYINWQFKNEDGWIKLIYEVENEVLGYAILAQRNFDESNKLSGMNVLTIIDIFWDFGNSKILDEILDYVEKYAQKQNADILIFSINHEYAQRKILRKGYFKMPGTVYFVVHSSKENINLSANLSDWFLTRGDADAAGTLGPEETV